jgi:hypothetical protein
MPCVNSVAAFFHRVWTGFFVLSLLFAAVIEQTSETRSQTRELSFGVRSELATKVLALPSAFAKPVSAPAPAIEPLGSSPFMVFLAVLAASMLLAFGAKVRRPRPAAAVEIPWLRACVRVVELRI